MPFKDSPDQKIEYLKLLWVGPLAGVLASVVNVILFYIGRAMGAFPTDYIVPNAGEPFTPEPVIFASMMGAIGATIAFALLAYFTKRPIFYFQIAAIVVFVLMFFTPFTLPDPPLLMVIFLEVMHVVAAIFPVYMLVTLPVSKEG